MCLCLRMVQGNWAESHVRSLTSDELDEFDRLLACENPDLFKYLTGQETEPDELKSNAVYAVRSGERERESWETESVHHIAAHNTTTRKDDRRLMTNVYVYMCMYMHRLCESSYTFPVPVLCAWTVHTACQGACIAIPR